MKTIQIPEIYLYLDSAWTVVALAGIFALSRRVKDLKEKAKDSKIIIDVTNVHTILGVSREELSLAVWRRLQFIRKIEGVSAKDDPVCRLMEAKLGNPTDFSGDPSIPNLDHIPDILKRDSGVIGGVVGAPFGGIERGPEFFVPSLDPNSPARRIVENCIRNWDKGDPTDAAYKAMTLAEEDDAFEEWLSRIPRIYQMSDPKGRFPVRDAEAPDFDISAELHRLIDERMDRQNQEFEEAVKRLMEKTGLATVDLVALGWSRIVHPSGNINLARIEDGVILEYAE